MNLLALLALLVATDSQSVYTVDDQQGSFIVHVGKSGVFGLFGSSHEIRVASFTGEVRWNRLKPDESTMWMTVPTFSLTVADEDVDDDTRAEIQADMERDALEAREYPEIQFRSTGFALKCGEGDCEGFVHGDLTLHGVTHPIDVHTTLTINDTLLIAKGEFELLGSTYNIEQVTAVAGTVRTSDSINISFIIHCKKRP